MIHTCAAANILNGVRLSATHSPAFIPTLPRSSRIRGRPDMARLRRLQVVHMRQAQVLHAAKHGVHKRVHREQVDEQQQPRQGLPPQHRHDAPCDRINTTAKSLQRNNDIIVSLR